MPSFQDIGEEGAHQPSEPEIEINMVNANVPVSTVLYLRKHSRVGDENIHVGNEAIGYSSESGYGTGGSAPSSGGEEDKDSSRAERLDNYIRYIEAPQGFDAVMRRMPEIDVMMRLMGQFY